MYVRIVDGSQVKPGDKLVRVNTNKTGRKPTGIFLGGIDKEMLSIDFSGNVRPTTASSYGVRWVPDE